MRVLLLALAASCLPLPAQGHGHGDSPHGTTADAVKPEGRGNEHGPDTPAGQSTATGGGKVHGERPVHRAHPDLPADAALQYLRDANARASAAHAAGEGPPPDARPAGAGRYVVAVIGCADSGLDARALFGLAPEDVLWIANAGATTTTDAADLVAWAAREHRVRLCVVLSHARCASLAGDEATKARGVPGAERRAAAARTLAERRRVSIADAQALVQAEQLRAALRSVAATAGQAQDPKASLGATSTLPDVRVVAASLEPATRVVTFLVPRAEELPIAPVR